MDESAPGSVCFCLRRIRGELPETCAMMGSHGLFSCFQEGGFVAGSLARLLVVPLGAGALLAVPAAHAAASTGYATIRITNVQTGFTFVDLGARGRGAGDDEIIRQSLYNRRISSKPIGRAEVLCTMLTRKTRSCTATYTLPRGNLVTSGMIGSRLLYELAIVGGTELFNNARGSLVCTTTALNPRRQVLVFRLAG
jgi:hypothetical protein